MMNTELVPFQSEKRDLAYDALRKFSDDSDQKGTTLSSVAPPFLAATKSLISKRAFITRMAYKPGYKIAANSLLVPAELLWASGYTPFNWEMFSSLIAFHSKVIDLTNKGSAPVPRCSFINALKGAFKEDILPVPDVTVSSSAFCEGISHMISELSENFNVPNFHLDIPGFNDELSVKSLAKQLESTFKALCKINSITEEDASNKLHETFYHSVRAKTEFLEILKLRKTHGPLNLGMEPLHWHGQFAPFWGDESGYRICNRLKLELINRIESLKNQPENENSIPLAMFGLIPYGRSDVWQQLKDANVNFTFEGVNYLGEIDLPEADRVSSMSDAEIFENMALQLINAPVRGLNFTEKADIFIKNALETGAKGIIIFSQEHCQMLAARLNEYENQASKMNLKFVSISGDVILGMPKGPTGLRLGTFLSELSPKKKHIPMDGDILSNNQSACIPEVRVGIDFGSGFSKYLAINRENKVIQQGLFTSGIDYPHLLNEIKDDLGEHKDINFALAGVGSDNTQLISQVHNQTTEINALILAVKTLFGHLNRFMVIDIGTQDVKVLKFHAQDQAPWINTNKSCGAGTGMVLVQILERWKQSNPEITFDDIDQMALDANKCELINTTCGIFAVTNVVSALIQSEISRRKEILSGVYQYIATQAIKLLPPETNTDFPLVLVGGVGRHKSLRKIFTQKGYKLLELPDSIPSQHLVAYGTALSLNQLSN